jgi:hypothetical protein
MVKPGATIIDVGITRVTDDEGKTKLVGDVDYEGKNCYLNFNLLYNNMMTDMRSGSNIRLVRKRSQVRSPYSTNVCVHMSVCIGSGCSLCIISMYLQKNI